MPLYLPLAAKTHYTDSMGRGNGSENPCKPRSHGFDCGVLVQEQNERSFAARRMVQH